MKIEVLEGDITGLEIQAIVNPANSKLIMGGGLAGIIKKEGGQEIQDEARGKAPVKVGEAIITNAGKLPSEYVIHAPTMEKPSQKISIENVRQAIQGILNCAEKNGIEEIAIPGLGTGVGGVSYEGAASAMVEELKNFESEKIKKVVLVGYGEELYQAFKEEKEKQIP